MNQLFGPLVRRYQSGSASGYRTALWAVALAAGLTGALYYRLLERSGPALSAKMGDSVVYLKLAAELRQGTGVTREVFYWSPLYPVLLALLGPELLIALQLAARAATVLLTGLLAGRHNRTAGLLAATIYTLYWTPLVYSCRLVPVALATLFLLFGFWLTVLPGSGSNSGRLLAGGVGIGIAGLLMPQMVLAAAALLPVLVRRYRVGSLAFVIGLVVAVSPTTIRNAIVGHDFVPISYSGGFNFYIGNNPNAVGGISRPPEMSLFRPGGRELITIADQEEFQRSYAESTLGRRLRPSEISDFWLERGARWLLRHPGRWAVLWLRKLLLAATGFELADSYYPEVERQMLWPLRLLPVSFALLLGLAAAGLVITRRRSPSLLTRSGGDGDAVPPNLMVLLSVLAGLILFFVNARFRLPAAPFLAVLAGTGLHGALSSLKGLRHTRDDVTPISFTPRRMVIALAVLVGFTGTSGLLLPRVFAEAQRLDRAYGFLNLSRTEQAVGNLANAEMFIERAARLLDGIFSEDLARTTVELGNRHLDRSNLKKAAQTYDLAMRQDPSYPPAFLMRGVVELMGGSAETALNYADQALQRDPGLASAWVLRARALLLLGDEDQAKDAAIRASHLDPDALLVRETLTQLGLLGPHQQSR